MKRPIILLLTLCLMSCKDAINDAVTDFEHLTPRPFGYVIGDEIEHRVIVNTRGGVILTKANLPTQGILNRWLNLNQISVNDSPLSDGGHHYEITLRYQIFYAPQSVKMLTIPSILLAFHQGNQAIEKNVPAWQFTISPLREVQMRKDEQGEYMRPNASVPFVTTPYAASILAASSFVLFGSGLTLAYFHGYISLPRRRIFKRANQQLAKLNSSDLTQSFSILHHALNTLNQKPLFTHQLPEFYTQYPSYQAAQKLLDDFFSVSTHYFFISKSPIDDTKVFELIKRTCERCAAIERGQK